MSIGDWTADPATNELRRRDEVVRLEPKAMDVLMALARRAGGVVSREELFAAAWPGLVVGDEALTQAITRLRRALGDDPRSPAYIETIPKRGYRMAAVVGEARDAPAPARPRRRWLPAALLAALLLPAALFFALRDRIGVPAEAPAPDAADAAWVTVSVLPFDSLGGEGGQAYFARGMSDSLMNELGRLSGLRLIAAANAAEAATRARYVVSGSVQRDAAMLRVHVRLVDGRSNEQLWSERFERPAADLFEVQDEIARRLAATLPAKLTETERALMAKRYTRSVAAYELFLEAQGLFLARGARENERARELYRRAIEIDPRFARAYAGLAMTHALEHRLGPAPDARALERAHELARTALLIDPDIAQVHWALGFVHAQARRHPQALESLRRAVEVQPSFADAYALMGGIHTYLGEPAKSIPLMRTAMRLKPEGGYLYYLLTGRAYLFEGDTEQALINVREALLRNPADLETRLYLAAGLAAAGDIDAAKWEAEEIRALEPGFSLAGWLASYPLTSAPHRARLQQLLGMAGLR